MAERPIKKSERQAKEVASGNEGETVSRPSPVSRSERSSSDRDRDRDRDRGGDRRKGKEGKRGKADDIKPPANLALMRGPKPAKAQPPVVEEIPEEPETTAEETAEETTEAASEETSSTEP
jgi:hypothetical protein